MGGRVPDTDGPLKSTGSLHSTGHRKMWWRRMLPLFSSLVYCVQAAAEQGYGAAPRTWSTSQKPGDQEACLAGTAKVQRRGEGGVSCHGRRVAAGWVVTRVATGGVRRGSRPSPAHSSLPSVAVALALVCSKQRVRACRASRKHVGPGYNSRGVPSCATRNEVQGRPLAAGCARDELPCLG